MTPTPTSRVIDVLNGAGVDHPAIGALAADLVGAALRRPEQVAELLDTAGVGTARSPETQALAQQIVAAVEKETT